MEAKEKIEEVLTDINTYETFEWDIRKEENTYLVNLYYGSKEAPRYKWQDLRMFIDSKGVLYITYADIEHALRYGSDFLEWLFHHTICKQSNPLT